MSTIHNADLNEFERELLGRRIISADAEKGRMTLDNGVVLELEDTSECCAWFASELEVMDLDENAITYVTSTEREPTDSAEEAWTINILSGHKTLARVNIEGDPTSGYYCYSINLKVTRPKEDLTDAD